MRPDEYEVAAGTFGRTLALKNAALALKNAALAAKDAEIERACALLGTRAMDPPDGGDPTLSERVGNVLRALEAAEAEVARLKGINELQADLLNGAIKRARDERERLKDGIKRAGAQLQASTRTMDAARDRIVGLERDLEAAIATERERCARVVLTFGYSERLENIAAAIRAG